MKNNTDSRKITSLLANEDRFKITAAVSLGANTLEKIAAMTGLNTPVIIKALVKLEAAGIVSKKENSGFVFNIESLKDVNRGLPANEVKKPALSGLERFFKDGKLITYPKDHDDQLLVLNHIIDLFEYNRRYTEKEVNEILKAVNPDYASLRRYLIDNVLFVREREEAESGVTVIYYWRVEYQ